MDIPYVDFDLEDSKIDQQAKITSHQLIAKVEYMF
jgi:hypothetical protein